MFSSVLVFSKIGGYLVAQRGLKNESMITGAWWKSAVIEAFWKLINSELLQSLGFLSRTWGMDFWCIFRFCEIRPEGNKLGRLTLNLWTVEVITTLDLNLWSKRCSKDIFVRLVSLEIEVILVSQPAVIIYEERVYDYWSSLVKLTKCSHRIIWELLSSEVHLRLFELIHCFGFRVEYWRTWVYDEVDMLLVAYLLWI